MPARCPWMLAWRHLAVLPVLGIACTFELDLDNELTVAFEYTMSGADEMSGMLMIPVVLSRPAELPVTVDYALLGGNGATPDLDFELPTGKLVFEVGEIRKEVPVTIKPDSDETEMVESFDIALSSPVGATLDPTRAIHSVRIADHILPRVTIGPTGTNASEASPSMLIVRLDRPSEGESTVVVGVAGGSPAAGPADLTIADGTVVTFANGQMIAMVPIGEKDDTLDEEDNEIAVFTLRGPSPNIVFGPTKTLNHAIADNDAPPIVRFNNATASVNENGLGETINISLSTASGRQVRVDFIRDANDTADNSDATVIGSPGTLTFDPGQTNKTIVLTVNNDAIDEDNETVLVNLSNAVNATFGAATHTLTIVDNDTASVSFMNSTSSVDEDAPGGIAITVRLATESSKTVTVPFSLNGGTTATNGQDFVIMTPSPLVFPPGTTQLTIDVDVPDNPPGNESNERVIIDLGTPTGAPLGGTTRHTLTISE
jgi:hypothetical protein